MALIATAVTAGTTLISGKMSADATKDAADASAQAQMYATDRTIESQQQATAKSLWYAKKYNGVATDAQVRGSTRGAKAKLRASNESTSALLGGNFAASRATQTGAKSKEQALTKAALAGRNSQNFAVNKSLGALETGATSARDSRLSGSREADKSLLYGSRQSEGALIDGAQDARRTLARGSLDSQGALVNSSRTADKVLLTGSRGAEKTLMTGSRQAQDALVGSNQQNKALFKDTLDKQSAGLAPWRDAGSAAIKSVSSGLQGGDFSMDNWNFQADPSYEFRKQQGAQALERSAVARGGSLSGGQLAALTDYNSNVASTEYAAAYGREQTDRQNNYANLMGVADRGQAAVNDTNALMSTYTDRTAGANLNIGNAQAQGLTDRAGYRADGLLDRAGISAAGIEERGGYQSDGFQDRAGINAAATRDVAGYRADGYQDRAGINAAGAVTRSGYQADTAEALAGYRAGAATQVGANNAAFYGARGDAQATRADEIARAQATQATTRGNVLSTAATYRGDVRAQQEAEMASAQAQGALNISNTANSSIQNGASIAAQAYQNEGQVSAQAAAASGQASAQMWGQVGQTVDGAMGNWMAYSQRNPTSSMAADNVASSAGNAISNWWNGAG